MARLPLTDEQTRAAGSRQHRIFIEANPGSGKTTVAAERYGVIRFDGAPDERRAITAVSFTRSATTELKRRIRGRWGPKAIGWPHTVMTIDTLVYSLVQHLLRTGILRWPGGHTTLQVLDDWRGHSGYRWLTPGNYRRVCTLDGNATVTSRGLAVAEAHLGFGNKQAFEDHLAQGRCTHEDVRAVLAVALRNPNMQNSVSRFMTASIGHLIVDEVFDANQLDLALVALACNAHIDVTLVGDPWQALYGFRGAKPDLVPKLIQAGAFKTLPLSHSFRFRNAEMKELATALRSGAPVSIGNGGRHDVVLASSWDALWSGPDQVLPLSFGRTTNKTDAAAIVLLDHIVHANFWERTIFLPEALILLELDPDTYESQGPAVLGNVVDVLGRTNGGPKKALSELRAAVKDLGAARRPKSGNAQAEQRQLDRLSALARRLRSPQLIPGMTIHQAKGREWDYVGVRLNEKEMASLSAGLNRDLEHHRALYVALTRGRYGVTAVP